MIDLLILNLLSPITLSFLLGLFAKRIGSDLTVPKDIYLGISLFLLFALGLKGGIELAKADLTIIALPICATIILSFITPISSYLTLRKLGRLSIVDSAAIAAHYGSVSAVTFLAAQTFIHEVTIRDITFPALEGYLPTLLAILEPPGIAIALTIGALGSLKEGQKISKALHEVFTGRTMILLLGGLAIGSVIGQKNWESVAPFFDTKGAIFRGLLCIFLLEMGVLAGARLSDFKKVGLFLLAFGIMIPLIHGFLAILLGSWAGLSIGGCTVFAAMAASASYIAAPPAVRMTLPSANPSYYLTLSLGITFPFNIVVGIPIFFELSKLICN